MRWIGVDIGTTHIKAVSIDPEHASPAETEPTPAFSDDGGVSRDPSALMASVKRVIARVVAQREDRRPVAGISVASVGEEVVVLDRHSAATGPILAWFDGRGKDEANAFLPSALHGRFPADSTWSLFKVLWLRRNRPDQLERATVVLDVGSFVLEQLGAPRVMDWSHASRTGFFDPVRTCWDGETLERAQIAAGLLPALVPSGTVVGAIAKDAATELGLQNSALLVAGGHDHFVGAFGSGVRVGGDFYLSAGTSEAQLALAEHPIAPHPGIDQGRFVDGTHWYVHCAAPGGHLFGQWRDLLFADDLDLLQREVAAERSPTGILVDLDANGRSASFHEVPLTASRGLVMRAVMEGAAIASAGVLAQLAAAVPDAMSRLVVAGHAADDPLWRSLRLGLSRRSMDVVTEREVTAIGTALLARRGVTGDAQPFSETTHYEPTRDDLTVARGLRAGYDAAPMGASA